MARITSISYTVSHYGGEGEFMVVILDFPNGDKLTEFIKLYLLSYTLGMFARYHPSVWTALLRNEKCDFAQPLLVDAVQAIERDFAQYLSSHLDGTGQEAVLTGPATSYRCSCSACRKPWR